MELQRPTEASGQSPVPHHPTVSSVMTHQLKAWLGESVTVKADGEPMVFFHGTANDITVFRSTSTGEFGPAIYTTTDPQEAGEYAAGQQKPGINVMPLFLKIQKPFTAGVEAFWAQFGREDGDAAAIERAKAAGFDGIVATRKNIYYDNIGQAFVDRGTMLEHYIVFSPDQVKSASGNNGDYSADTDDIRFSMPEAVLANSHSPAERPGSHPLPEEEFYSTYVQHIDLQARGGLNNVLSIFEEGFRRSRYGQYGNTLPPYRGGVPTSVIDANYIPRKGDVVYLVPKEFTRETGSGQTVDTGWKPQAHEVVIASEDKASMYQEYLKAFERPAPRANGAEFGQLLHGTAKAFTEYSPSVGRRRGGGYDHQGPGFYLTSDPGFGRFFARTAASQTDDDYNGEGVVMDLQLKPETKILDLRSPNVDTLARLLFKDSTNSKDQGLALRARVLALGFDGVAFTEPNFPEGWKVGAAATTVVVYEPSLVAIPGTEPTDAPSISGGKARMPVTVDMIGRNSVRAFAGKRIVGGASAWEDSRGAFVILKAEVKEPYRRRGIATAMYKAIEEAAGKNLVPAVSISDEAFEFWKSFRPEAVAKDLRHRKEELVGAKAVKNGRLGTIVTASGGIATMRFDDAEEGSANSQTFIRRDALDAAIAAAALLKERTNTQAFKNWFGPSVVTQNNLPGGKPMVVYHGTQSAFTAFDLDMQGGTVNSEDVGFFFTNYPREADSYAMMDWDKEDVQPNVMPVYLSIRNPKLIDISEAARPGEAPAIWYDNYGREESEKAMADGHDGLIVCDRSREPMLMPDGTNQTLYVAFRPDQIKSAIGNNGDFDTRNDDIRFSMPDNEDEGAHEDAPTP